MHSGDTGPLQPFEKVFGLFLLDVLHRLSRWNRRYETRVVPGVGLHHGCPAVKKGGENKRRNIAGFATQHGNPEHKRLSTVERSGHYSKKYSEASMFVWKFFSNPGLIILQRPAHGIFPRDIPQTLCFP